MNRALVGVAVRHSILAGCLLLIAGGAQTQAATLVTYPFTTNFNPSFVAPGVTTGFDTSNLSPGTGVFDDGFGNVLQAYPNTGSTDAALALANNSFFSLTISITPGTLGFTQFLYEVGKGGDSDPRGYFVRTSLDGFASDVFSQMLPAGPMQAPAQTSFGLDLSAVNSITLRFYVFTPIPIDNSVDFRNLTVSNSSTQPPTEPIPEPATWALTGLGIAAVGFWRRRRS